MKRDISMFVEECPNCQQVKAEHLKPGGLTQSIEIPTWKWDAINMDFVVCLPWTRKLNDSIWVIIDRMTKLVTSYLYSLLTVPKIMPSCILMR